MDAHLGVITFFTTLVLGGVTAFYATYSKQQWTTMNRQLEISQSQFDLAQRPWIEPKHQGIGPLVFDTKRGWTAEVNGIFENTGASIALNLLSWEDMLPFNGNTQFGPAKRRQEEWCDANRHPKPTFVTGEILFPKGITQFRTTVAIAEKGITADTHGLVIVGCVVYRASYDAPDRPTRQTRYAYILSVSDQDVIMGVPKSKDVPKNVFLVKLPALWSAD
jgi:hypothetical protein